MRRLALLLAGGSILATGYLFFGLAASVDSDREAQASRVGPEYQPSRADPGANNLPAYT